MTQQAHGKARALVLEDEALIALDLQDELQDAGYEVAGPFTTCAAALEWLRTETPDIAILDAALKDGPCREIALELSRREVPFLIYSGHHEDRQLLAEFDHLTWIEKPVPPSVLVQACQKLVAGHP
ncbi:response regulator [Microvirga calopogonii]|uniref:response regulator n=1 Tax=Microvirga calopogonii TaxID=2078013 RepID=UPI000E0D5974|nr:response regulator [Microvirga calopogonii]